MECLFDKNYGGAGIGLVRFALQAYPRTMSRDSIYIERGSGPVVVFCHGSMMDYSMFAPQLAYLARKYRVVAYNNRTWAEPDTPLSLDDLVEDCRIFLDGLNIERCVLAGMSMGGHMAIPFALKYQERLDGLVVTGAGAAAFPQEIQEITGKSFSELDIEGKVPLEWAEKTAHVVFGETTFKTNRALIDLWTNRWTEARARTVYHQGMTWIYKEDLSDRVGDIRTPTLIVQGEEEMAYLTEWTLPMLEVMADATLTRIPRAGHFANLEQPEAVNRALWDFLGRVYADGFSKDTP